MCGLAGFIDHSSRAGNYDPATIAQAMGDALAHRGPDDNGLWIDREAGVALAHRRLSILDLSPAGHQPMVSACGRLVLIYNGEVYSHDEMRPALAARGIRFRGHSDTEVILESCAAFGVERTLEWMIGMFAFALWDRETRTLTLARDRLGIKPLYWGAFGGLLVFGSELKALHAHPGWKAHIDRDAVAAYLRHGAVPAPHSIFAGILKLEPGCLLTVRAGAEPQLSRFWDARQIVARAIANRLDELADAEAIAQLDALLRDAVSRRMLADVPVGAFLSGGIDSSTVVALMQAASERPVRTFTIGFTDDALDEAKDAKAVAKHLRTDHTELYLAGRDALALIPQLPQCYDEPFADSSQIPTLLISQLTRRHVSVALSGDGGDELFAGYNRYAFTAGLWQTLRRVPLPLRRLGARALGALPPGAWNKLTALAPRRLRPSQPGDKITKLAGVMGLNCPDRVYRALVSQWDAPEDIVVGAHEPRGLLWDDTLARTIADPVERMQFLDLAGYLPDDILTKLDRASMTFGLEARVPLLDHRVVEFAFRLPARFKHRNGKGKWLLRQVLARYVPPALVERPKMGFSVPLAAWLRGELREWAEALLVPARLAADDLLRPAPIRKAWQEHLSGARDRQHALWAVLMLQAWREHWRL